VSMVIGREAISTTAQKSFLGMKFRGNFFVRCRTERANLRISARRESFFLSETATNYSRARSDKHSARFLASNRIVRLQPNRWGFALAFTSGAEAAIVRTFDKV
jgi:hypothetical protein